MTLLIVNDEILTLNILEKDILWKEYGIDIVYTANDGQSARKVIEEKEVDILLCDIEMPGEDGIKFVRWIREQNIPIECIFLTCHANFAYARDAIMLDCKNYILFPAKSEEIGEAVRKVAVHIKEKREKEIFVEYGKNTLKKKMEEISPCSVGKKDSKEIVQNAIQYILDNIEEQELSIDKVANSVFMHPVYLNRIFKKYCGMSIGKYIVGERMKYASCLLKNTSLSVSEVAEKTGYSYYANFQVMFKKYYGITPVQYQKNNKDNEKEIIVTWNSESSDQDPTVG